MFSWGMWHMPDVLLILSNNINLFEIHLIIIKRSLNGCSYFSFSFFKTLCEFKAFVRTRYFPQSISASSGEWPGSPPSSLFSVASVSLHSTAALPTQLCLLWPVAASCHLLVTLTNNILVYVELLRCLLTSC